MLHTECENVCVSAKYSLMYILLVKLKINIVGKWNENKKINQNIRKVEWFTGRQLFNIK